MSITFNVNLELQGHLDDEGNFVNITKKIQPCDLDRCLNVQVVRSTVVDTKQSIKLDEF